MFRLRPAESFFAVARERRVGILARVPLASGLLSGKLRADTPFEAGDHRNFNRRGEAFDVGETFSGVDYDAGLRAVEELRPLVPPGATLAQLALRWILMFPEVTAPIPGARNAEPAESFFAVARERRVGILARVPLASGLLSGKLRADTAFEPGDHRNYNRHGEAFDVGETFSGVDYETGLAAVEELRALVPAGATMAQLALRWILMFPEVSAAIPGAKNVQQTEDNVLAANLRPFTPDEMAAVRDVYDRSIRPLVHHRW